MKSHMDVLTQFRQKTGKQVSPGGSVQNIVLETDELRRVRDLPRRDWLSDNPEETVELLTELLKTEQGTQMLKVSQAMALKELSERLGLFAPVRVGGGKTLISLLASQAVPSLRTLLLVPAGLIDKTYNDLYAYHRDWKILPLQVESYEMLSRDRDDRILGALRPDLIIADEAHKLKNTSAGCTKRLSRYMRTTRKAGLAAGAEWPYGVSFVAMSGTITTRSLREYWHLLRWALGPYAPLPHDVEEFTQWAAALDERVSIESRWQPGALERLSPNPEGQDVLRRARNAYASRLVSTPGVISTRGDIPPMSLRITGHSLDAPPVIRDAITEMRETWCTPDGHPFEQPTDLWRHARELQCGFYYVWDPRPPGDWLEARMDWHRYVRDVLKRYASAGTLATPGDVTLAVMDGRLEDGQELLETWRDVRDSFKPNSVPQWLDDTVIRYAADWLNTGNNKGKLCWVEHRAFGPRLAEATGIPYFGAEGKDKNGNLIDSHKGPAIVSVRTCGTGRNLQSHYHNLYLSPMSKADWWEQSLGRTHRDGQKEDEVLAEVLFMCRESYSSMIYAIREAEYTQETTHEPQKLGYATKDLGQIEALVGRRDDDMWKQEVQGV